jgi:hypothetical protein
MVPTISKGRHSFGIFKENEFLACLLLQMKAPDRSH